MEQIPWFYNIVSIRIEKEIARLVFVLLLLIEEESGSIHPFCKNHLVKEKVCDVLIHNSLLIFIPTTVRWKMGVYSFSFFP